MTNPIPYLGLKSPGNVAGLLKRLEERDYISRARGRECGITIIGKLPLRRDDLVSALYSARETIRSLKSHLAYTLPADGKITKTVHRDAALLYAQASDIIAKLSNLLPEEWRN